MLPEPPPLPTLFDTQSDAARAREKAIKRPLFGIRFGAPPPAPAPPEPLPQNSWRILAETLPVNASTVRQYKPVTFAQNAVVTARSAFRKGSLSFGADGLTLAGVGVKPIGWLGKLGGAGYFVWFICLMSNAFTNSSLPEFVRWIGMGGFVVGLLGSALTNGITEARRVPLEIRLAWSDVLEAQFERDSRWVVLMYRDAPKKVGTLGAVKHLPISHMTPAHAAALWDALDAYAPGRIRINTTIAESHPFVITLLLALIGALFFLITILITRNMRP